MKRSVGSRGILNEAATRRGIETLARTPRASTPRGPNLGIFQAFPRIENQSPSPRWKNDRTPLVLPGAWARPSRRLEGSPRPKGGPRGSGAQGEREGKGREREGTWFGAISLFLCKACFPPFEVSLHSIPCPSSVSVSRLTRRSLTPPAWVLVRVLISQ